MRSIKTLFAALILTAFALSAQASPGGLDKFGGHTDHKTGQYHFHQLDGKKLAEPLPGEDPNKNGGKIVYTGTPKFSGEAASEKKAPAAKAEKPAKMEKMDGMDKPAAAPAAEDKAAKPAKKAKKAKEPKAVKEPKAEKEKAEPKAEKSEKKEKKAKKSKKEKADKAAADDKK